MTLREWMEAKGLGVRAAARVLEMNHSQVHHLIDMATPQDPRLSTVDQIALHTKGAVTRLDWPNRVAQSVTPRAKRTKRKGC